MFVHLCVCVFVHHHLDLWALCVCMSCDLNLSENSNDGLSVTSGSADASFYLTPRQRKSQRMMSMPKTLALCYLALLWAREAITLADLLRSQPQNPYWESHVIILNTITIILLNSILIIIIPILHVIIITSPESCLENHQFTILHSTISRWSDLITFIPIPFYQFRSELLSPLPACLCCAGW